MADSTSDSGSVQSLPVEQSSEKKMDINNRFYALYSFNAFKFTDLNLQSENKQASAVEQTDGSLSLNIVATNLTASAETDLRKSLAHKVSKNSPKPGDGVFFSIGLQSPKNTSSSSMPAVLLSVSASCYYCLTQITSDNLGFDIISHDEKTKDMSQNETQQFLVCFLSFQDSSLEQFHSELNLYTKNLIPLLDKEPLSLPTLPQRCSDASNKISLTALSLPVDSTELTQLSTRIHSYLEKWPYVVLGYVTRTIQYFGFNMQHLLYSALLNANLQFSGATEEQEDDIKKFISCFSISNLVEQLQSAENGILGHSNELDDLWLIQPIVVTVTFKGQSVIIDKTYGCNFCSLAAEKLLTLDPTNVSKIKEFLENIKLTFVHCLNKLKRFLKQAEVDYYALYRAFSYLKKCGCGHLLVRYVKLDGGPETLSVLTVLETFIKDMKQTLL